MYVLVVTLVVYLGIYCRFNRVSLSDTHTHIHTHIYVYVWVVTRIAFLDVYYGVATISRLLQVIGLFCRI